MQIIIRDYLTDRGLPGPADDHDLERRLYLEDRIKALANKTTLGPEFVGAEFTQSQLGVRGQEKADFHFVVPDQRSLQAETKRLADRVTRFMEAVRRRASS
jgi:hypothetical protein